MTATQRLSWVRECLVDKDASAQYMRRSSGVLDNKTGIISTELPPAYPPIFRPNPRY